MSYNDEHDEHDEHDDEAPTVDRQAILEVLHHAVDAGEKVTLSRAELGGETWGVFPLLLSNDLMLVRTLRDFAFDGFAVIRLHDITAARSGELERFFEHVLRAEGMLDGLRPPKPVLLRSWRTVLEGVRAHYRFAIVECEGSDDDDFFLGELVGVDEEHAVMHYIQANGTRDAEPTRIPLDDVTLVRFDDPYVNLFGKYCIAEDHH